MMSCVVDLYQWRNAPQSLSHPAGVRLPLEDPEHAEFLIPQLRHAISTGKHCADLIRALPAAVRPGDRVLLIGSGIGIVSTLVAKMRGVQKVIVMEPNIPLAEYIGEVHRVNGVPWVETLNAVPAVDRSARVPLFVRHDVRTSSLVPDDGPWRHVMLIPGVDLDLVLAEEGISLMVADSAMISPEVARQVRLGSAVRGLVGFPQSMEARFEDDGPAGTLAGRAGAATRFGAALMLPERGNLEGEAEFVAGVR